MAYDGRDLTVPGYAPTGHGRGLTVPGYGLTGYGLTLRLRLPPPLPPSPPPLPPSLWGPYTYSDVSFNVSCVYRAQDTYPNVFQAYPVYLPVPSTQVIAYSTHSEYILVHVPYIGYVLKIHTWIHSRYMCGIRYIPDTSAIHRDLIAIHCDTPRYMADTCTIRILRGYVRNTYAKR